MSTVIWRVYEGSSFYSKLGRDLYSAVDVAFGVSPVASDHRAGVVWTADGWQTVSWAAATWDKNVANPYGGLDELWTARLLVSYPPPQVRFQYALYVEDAQGIRYWDNNQGWNYQCVVAV